MQKAGEIPGQFAFKPHGLSGARVYKAQHLRVQALAAQPLNDLFGAVNRVPRHRMAQISHVHPDLMGAPGFQP